LWLCSTSLLLVTDCQTFLMRVFIVICACSVRIVTDKSDALSLPPVVPSHCSQLVTSWRGYLALPFLRLTSPPTTTNNQHQHHHQPIIKHGRLHPSNPNPIRTPSRASDQPVRCRCPPPSSCQGRVSSSIPLSSKASTNNLTATTTTTTNGSLSPSCRSPSGCTRLLRRLHPLRFLLLR
jgi:hypothetical protein